MSVESDHLPTVDTMNTRRGRWGMQMFIATEAMLFVFLLFSYFYLGSIHRRWPPGQDPKFMLAIVLTVILVSSSVVLHWGEVGLRRGDIRRLQAGLVGTLSLGILFLVVQVFEYREHLKELKPRSGAYGAVFYTITSMHGAHVVVGLLILGFMTSLAVQGQLDERRHIGVSNASLYWHFVDVVWLLIFAILYLSPHFYR